MAPKHRRNKKSVTAGKANGFPLFTLNIRYGVVYFALTEANARNISLETLYEGQLTLSTQLIKPKFSCNIPR